MSLPQEIYSDLKDQLPGLIEAIKTGAEYGMDLAQRFVIYDLLMHLLQIVLLFGFHVGLVVVSYKAFKEAKEMDKGAAKEMKGLPTFVAVLLGLFFSFIIANTSSSYGPNVDIVVKDLLVPELRIVEILQEQLK